MIRQLSSLDVVFFFVLSQCFTYGCKHIVCYENPLLVLAWSDFVRMKISDVLDVHFLHFCRSHQFIHWHSFKPVPIPQNVWQCTQKNLDIMLYRVTHPLLQLEVILFSQLSQSLYSFLLIVEKLLYSLLLGLRSRGLLLGWFTRLRHWAKIYVVQIIHQAT